MTRKQLIEAAFQACIELGHRLKSAEFHLGFMPEKPLGGLDLESAQVHLQDVRASLGVIALRLADMAAAESEIRTLEELLTDAEAWRRAWPEQP